MSYSSPRFATWSGPWLWRRSGEGGGESFSESPIGYSPVGLFFREVEVKSKISKPDMEDGRKATIAIAQRRRKSHWAGDFLSI